MALFFYANIYNYISIKYLFHVILATFINNIQHIYLYILIYLHNLKEIKVTIVQNIIRLIKYFLKLQKQLKKYLYRIHYGLYICITQISGYNGNIYKYICLNETVITGYLSYT